MPAFGNAIIELRSVSKRYGQTVVLNGINFSLQKGEVHGLIGENGAGKSTTMKLLAGVYSDYDGEMLMHGSPIRFTSPATAMDNGIGMVYQELSVFKHLTVAENIFGRNPPIKNGVVNWKKMNHDAQAHLDELGVDINVTDTISTLSVGKQQIVEIARIIFSGAQVIILDEPTSALSPQETQRLFEFISLVKQQGKSVIFISHFLEDVLSITDRITVFKNGRTVETLYTNRTNKHQLVELMIGADAKVLHHLYEQDNPGQQFHSIGDPVLTVDALSSQPNFSDISFSLFKGEILGVFGFMGAGQVNLARCLFGAEQAESGSVILQGHRLQLKNTTQGRDAGIAYVPENRHDSLMLQQEIFKNISLPHLNFLTGWMLNTKKEINIALQQLTDLIIKPGNPSIEVGTLSGGNQQKVVLAKWLTRLPTLLILNEPTRGIDIGAKDEILTIIKRLSTQGVSILLITSEPEMILAMANRSLVMSKGRITATLEGTTLTKKNLMQHA